MKCAYVQVMQEKKDDEYRGLYRTMGMEFMVFLDMSIGVIVHNLCGHAKTRLGRMFDSIAEDVDGRLDVLSETNVGEIPANATDELRELMEQIKSRHEDPADSLKSARVSYRMNLKDCGFDLDAETAAHAFVIPPLTGSLDPAKEANYNLRKNFLEVFDDVVVSYHASVLEYFRAKHRYGAGRMRVLYRLMREDYNRYAANYMRCCEYGDSMRHRMTRERQAVLEKMGVPMIEIKE